MDIYTVKNQILNYLTKAQKSGICHYIASFVKKHYKKELPEIVELFIEEEKYYLDIKQSRFPWLNEYIENDDFLKDVELYIKENQKACFYKETQKPIYEQQKLYAKEQRKKVQDFKMSKQPPTKAQTYYYKSLCKKYNFEPELDLETASRLDFKTAISEILEKTKQNKF
ncbi:MAG TPA: hypothetical protein P5556_05110 [Candidatus Gastranaerophilales bacterium]|nr:hypothetical protein [Candidatus Gastranaerophilales bacterium]